MSIHISAELNMRNLSTLLSSRVGESVRREVSKGIRDGLQVLESDHKKVQFRRGAGRDASTHPTQVTWRTGQLARSYRIYYVKGDLFGYYGSDLQRARILEEGDTIHMKDKLLTVPTSAARKGVGMGLGARHLDLEFMWGIYKKTGKKALGRDGVVWFWLVEQVTIPARPMLARSKHYRAKEITQIIQHALWRGATGDA